MRRTFGPVAALGLALAIATGCAAGAASPSLPPDADGFALRAWITQALPPQDAFRTPGVAFAIHDGLLITPGAVPAIYPGPLLTPLFAQRISEMGEAAILDAARQAGLLDGPTDLTGGPQPGAPTGHLLLVIDGVEREVVGNPNSMIVCITTPCDAAPGSPEAFGGYWSLVSNAAGWLGPEVGEPETYEPERLGVLLTEPVLDATMPIQRSEWPLDDPMAELGVELDGPAGTPPVRCGVIEGDALPGALAAFGAANQLTRWVDGTGAEFGAVTRPLFPGEPDPCTG